MEHPTGLTTSRLGKVTGRISRLDFAQVAVVGGHTKIAERHLIDGIFNRRDDAYGPVDLPERTSMIVKQRGWARSRSRAQRRFGLACPSPRTTIPTRVGSGCRIHPCPTSEPHLSRYSRTSC